MTFERIEELIFALNQKESLNILFREKLSHGVVYMKLELEEDRVNTWIQYRRFYFIKDEEGCFIGAVYDAVGDLQWFVRKEYRKKGYLVNALSKTILPHLHIEKNRSVQIISICRGSIDQEDYQSSCRVAELVGFVRNKIDETRFELDLSFYR